MNARCITVLKPGLETTVQELPGRIGYLEQGFPVSGPFDKWSFRQANLLAGNPRDTAALECQFLGPTLRFDCDATVAVTGADMRPKLDGEPAAMWRSLPVRAGQVLELAAAYSGARGYVAVSGGIDTPVVLGSRAVFHMARVGGQALARDQVLPLGPPPSGAGDILAVPEASRPPFSTDKTWQIEALAGPNDDWLDPASVEMFFSADWSVQAKSNRTGIRLSGPQFAFAGRALDKSSDHGQDPSNIIDHGYPLGAVNLAGQTPIILVNDAPSTGGFINPFTVASAAFWKLAQAKPGDVLRFRRIDREEAGRLRAALETVTSAGVAVRV
ncbi:biotin-dependent carboxyltransferase family protein [Shinella pollutisoli]|uniref:Biotin-dependent carboxyltransferase family protein n=1 Tax=Shinella pollutisoli TaxID=2250594 RepID=A0ABV7DHC6_9HYPH|nr:biotin-dependent carboxyltransferase family protein [Shinella pollutisoli]